MSRDVNLFSEDMQTACEKVARYVKNLKQKQFLEDEKTYDAVVRSISRLKNPCNWIPPPFRQS